MAGILVTGGAGFIGSNFVHYWTSKYPDDRVVVLDALTYAGNLANLASVSELPSFRFIKGDIGDRELVDRVLVEEAVSTIVHFAAESHVDRSIHGPADFIRTNIVGTHNLLEAARDTWLRGSHSFPDHRFHHISTDEVYGSLGKDDPPFSEDTSYAPNSPYSASKAASDHLVRAYHHTYGLQTTISNCSNNYGPYQFPEKLIPLMIVNVLDGKPLPVYGDGSNIRDWLHVHDHVRAIDAVIGNGRVGECYNIGGGEERSNLDIVNTICRCIDSRFSRDGSLAKRFPLASAAKGRDSAALITMVDDRPGHDWRYAINAERIRAELGYSPDYNFETGLEETIAWMLENEPWWRAVLDDSYRTWMDLNYGQAHGER